jgi:SSS family solute:Na+ symporter
MTPWDWLLVLVINLGIVLYGLVTFKGTRGSFDWYLAAKSLPWWAVGLSAFSTAVDSGDYVAIAGGSYRFGLSQLSQWWLGIAIGWFLLSCFVIIPMYRSGVYTNAEWLEFRFGPIARVLAVFINVQSRTNVVGNIYFSLYLVLSLIGELSSSWSWALVVGVGGTAMLYVIRGGLESDVITKVFQALAMIVASFVLWGVVWFGSGGWQGLHQKLASVDDSLPDVLLHVGGYAPAGATPILVVFGWVVVLTTYVLINQYETIRFLGARSEWDFKMGALVASGITAICLWFNVTMGPLARAEFPHLEIIDSAYPLMVREYLPAGLIGLVLAGLVAAGYSTFASVGMGVSSLFVRDVYARFLVRKGSDAHYTLVGKIAAPVILALGFLYVPFLKSGMLAIYLRLAGAIAVPLTTVILMGVFTRVHRATGTIGLLAGLTYGTSALLGDYYRWPIPSWYTNLWWAYLWNLLLPAAVMLVCSWIITLRRGPTTEEELEGLIYSRRQSSTDLQVLMGRRLKVLEGTWLQQTLLRAPSKPRYPFSLPPGGKVPWRLRPELWILVYLCIISWLLFFVFW